jgi:drug/metabolite transporter (DMT)-like permease
MKGSRLRLQPPEASSRTSSSQAQRQTLLAVLLVIGSGVLFVTMTTLVKALTASLDAMVITWGRYFFHVAFVILVFPRSIVGVARSDQVAVQIGRSVLLLAATLTNFLALTLLPLADVASIVFLAPILVAGLAVLILHERVAIWRWVWVGLGFFGALLIVRPGGADFGLGAILALGCALAYSLYQITTRIVREAQPIVSLLYGGLVGTLVLSAILPFHWQAPTLGQWSILAVIGTLGASGHLLVILALQRAEASRVAPFTYVQLIWAMLASFVVFGDVPALTTLAGAAIIVASGLLLYQLDLKEAATKAATV